MRIKDTLDKPYTEEERINFILKYQYGYELKETEEALECWEYTEEEIDEQNRIARANLHLTRGDVFRALLLAKNKTRADIRALIEIMPESTPQEKINKELALIDFDEALEFYRGVTLIDTLGSQLGISSEQMDRFFETNDWHELNAE